MRKVKSSQIFPVCHEGPKPTLAPPPPYGTYIPTGRGHIQYAVYVSRQAGQAETVGNRRPTATVKERPALHRQLRLRSGNRHESEWPQKPC